METWNNIYKFLDIFYRIFRLKPELYQSSQSEPEPSY